MESVIETLSFIRPLFYIIHAIGFSLGLGGATINDVLFFKFLKDLKISKFESSVLNAMSKVIWVGLILLIISGIGLYIPEAERLNESSKFLLKMLVVSIILFNGVALNTIISPKLRRISFEKPHEHVSGELRHLRRIAFALGGISIVSWYSALVLGALRSIPFTFIEAASIYMFFISGAILTSQLAEYMLSKKKRWI